MSDSTGMKSLMQLLLQCGWLSLSSGSWWTLLLCLFQFLTFAERLANVNIDVIHRIDRTGSYAEVCALTDVEYLFFFLGSQLIMTCVSLCAGSRNILLRGTDKMERPQLDRAFQYVYASFAYSKCYYMLWTEINELILHSYISERGVQQKPVIQPAGFPSEVDSGESEDAPECQRQSGLSAAAGVSCLCCSACVYQRCKIVPSHAGDTS